MSTPVKVDLPPLPDRERLADSCRDTAAKERVQPAAVEKDFYLTRVLWALGQLLGDRLLLKGGTLLSKVDLGFRRLSEDADLVLPGEPSSRVRNNALALNVVRDALRAAVGVIGVQLPFPDGEKFDRGSHRLWRLPYGSAFGEQAITVEASIRPTLRPPRRAVLCQLLSAPDLGDYTPAFCFALDEDEARAEKVRAAFTREAIRDFYDLEQLARAGKDLTSPGFRILVDAKLAELKAVPLAEQAPSFALNPARRRELEVGLRVQLPAVLRVDEPAYDLNGTIERFNRLWFATLSGDGR